MLLCFSLTNGWREKGTLSIKILVLSFPELEFCHSRKPKKNSKLKVIHDNQVCCLNSFIVYYDRIMKSGKHFCKPEPRASDLEKIWCSLTNLSGGRIFFRSDKTLKVAKKIKDKSVVCWFFLVLVRSQQKPMYACNLESSLHSNIFAEKEIIVQLLRMWQKKLAKV